MENFNNNPVDEAVVEAPVVEEALVAETAPVEETPAEPTEVHVEEPVVEEPVVEDKPEDVISRPSYAGKTEAQALASVEDGVIGATTVPRLPKSGKASKAAVKKETVALHSTKNVTWEGVGKVYRGYNIVEKSAAEKWLTRSHVRIATPEEVAKEFGK